MPVFTEPNVRHLLRRAEFVDRQFRVDELLSLGSLEAAVDNIVTVPTSVVSATFTTSTHWERGVELVDFWLDQIAHTERCFSERMAFFWHGHLCSESTKAGGPENMREQLDTFRRNGLGSMSDLVKTIATQPAMLRYLDNHLNFKDSPNQNFARELIELFLLGVGNYTEHDVEAATSAWTGHSLDSATGQHLFIAEQHEPAPLTVLGQTVNAGAGSQGGPEMIDVILGTGSVGIGKIPVGQNVGRQANVVAAEFMSRKLWQEFGEASTGIVPPAVSGAMAASLTGSGFDITAAMRTMFLHDDFYTEAALHGLVRQPLEYVVALMHATGLPAKKASQISLMGRAGQQILYPPNVSGWRPNDYWINASTIEARNWIAIGCVWRVTETTWKDGGYMDLGHGRIERSVFENGEPADVVEHLMAATGLRLSPSTSSKVVAHLQHPDVYGGHRLDALQLILLSPEMHMA